MFVLSIIVALVAAALYGFVLFQKLRADEMRAVDRLKSVFATIHLQIDELGRIKSLVYDTMQEEKPLWQEFDAAVTQLKQALDSFDLSQIVAADSEMNRCEFDLKERVASYETLRHQAEVKALMKEVETLDSRLTMHVDEYNSAVQQFNRKCQAFPYLIIRKVCGFDVKQRFLHEAATVMDPNLSAVVID